MKEKKKDKKKVQGEGELRRLGKGGREGAEEGEEEGERGKRKGDVRDRFPKFLFPRTF